LSRIKILSEHLANQIAAGEVIERPASVVKELLENSIDAGARQVQIEIEGNGTKLIKVIDDGMGMNGDDALLCLERHATSKLGESTNDSNRLSAIRSLGFRGEAIPSIGSVSKMSITSRTENDSLGTRVEVRYGKILKIHETGCNKGTVVEIKNLFGNLPVRKKFLKSSRTELFHIEEIIKNYCLANSQLGITYTVNSNTVFDFPAETDSLEDRVKMLYAKKSEPLIPIEDSSQSSSFNNNINLAGFLLSPEQSFGASTKLRLFVNGRTVKDRMMSHAVTEGLSGYLMKGRTAAGALFITLPHEAVDVNVHPTKQEIRFQQPNIIHQRIVSAVQSAMAAFQKESKHSIFGSDENLGSRRTEQIITPKNKENTPESIGTLWNRSQHISAKTDNNGSAPYLSSGEDRSFSPPQYSEPVLTAEPTTSLLQTENENLMPESLKPIGQLMDLYLLCEAQRGEEKLLVVIDQHAVHERILFENLKKQFDSKQMASQNLLFPKMLELDPELAEIFNKNSEQIKKLGIVVEEFGGDNYIIKAVPTVISHLDPEEILTGILMQFSGSGYDHEEGRKRTDATRIEDILSSMACKAAIKAGRILDPLEMQEILKLMKESKAFTHCPHGRPVVQIFSAAEIKKWFHRT
jgi:DNA mismatch repair protein MutL